MKKLKLMPCIYAGNLPNDVETEEFVDKVSTHYQNDIVYIDWDDEEDFPKFKTWLVKEYGEEVKQYEKFAIEST